MASRSRFESKYKDKTKLVKEDKRPLLNAERQKISRNVKINSLRAIDTGYSPLANIKEPVKPKEAKEKLEDRRILLMKWKQEKEQRKQREMLEKNKRFGRPPLDIKETNKLKAAMKPTMRSQSIKSTQNFVTTKSSASNKSDAPKPINVKTSQKTVEIVKTATARVTRSSARSQSTNSTSSTTIKQENTKTSSARARGRPVSPTMAPPTTKQINKLSTRSESSPPHTRSTRQTIIPTHQPQTKKSLSSKSQSNEEKKEGKSSNMITRATRSRANIDQPPTLTVDAKKRSILKKDTSNKMKEVQNKRSKKGKAVVAEEEDVGDYDDKLKGREVAEAADDRSKKVDAGGENDDAADVEAEDKDPHDNDGVVGGVMSSIVPKNPVSTKQHRQSFAPPNFKFVPPINVAPYDFNQASNMNIPTINFYPSSTPTSNKHTKLPKPPVSTVPSEVKFKVASDGKSPVMKMVRSGRSLLSSSMLVHSGSLENNDNDGEVAGKKKKNGKGGKSVDTRRRKTVNFESNENKGDDILNGDVHGDDNVNGEDLIVPFSKEFLKKMSGMSRRCGVVEEKYEIKTIIKSQSIKKADAASIVVDGVAVKHDDDTAVENDEEEDDDSDIKYSLNVAGGKSDENELETGKQEQVNDEVDNDSNLEVDNDSKDELNNLKPLNISKVTRIDRHSYGGHLKVNKVKPKHVRRSLGGGKLQHTDDQVENIKDFVKKGKKMSNEDNVIEKKDVQDSEICKNGNFNQQQPKSCMKSSKKVTRMSLKCGFQVTPKILQPLLPPPPNDDDEDNYNDDSLEGMSYSSSKEHKSTPYITRKMKSVVVDGKELQLDDDSLEDDDEDGVRYSIAGVVNDDNIIDDNGDDKNEFKKTVPKNIPNVTPKSYKSKNSVNNNTKQTSLELKLDKVNKKDEGTDNDGDVDMESYKPSRDASSRRYSINILSQPHSPPSNSRQHSNNKHAPWTDGRPNNKKLFTTPITLSAKTRLSRPEIVQKMFENNMGTSSPGRSNMPRKFFKSVMTPNVVVVRCGEGSGGDDDDDCYIGSDGGSCFKILKKVDEGGDENKFVEDVVITNKLGVEVPQDVTPKNGSNNGRRSKRLSSSFTFRDGDEDDDNEGEGGDENEHTPKKQIMIDNKRMNKDKLNKTIDVASTRDEVFKTPLPPTSSVVKKRRASYSIEQLLSDPGKCLKSFILKNLSPEQCIQVLNVSPMIEMRRKKVSLNPIHNFNVFDDDDVNDKGGKGNDDKIINDADITKKNSDRIDEGDEMFHKDVANEKEDGITNFKYNNNDDNMNNNNDVDNNNEANDKDNNNNRKSGSHFELLMKGQQGHLEEMCDEWRKYMEECELSDEGQGHIRVAIGKAELLIKERFNQFQSLIHDHVTGKSAKKVTAQDLQGFWDMVLCQVDDVGGMFRQLHVKKQNNWLEEEVKEQTSVKNKIGNKKSLKKVPKVVPNTSKGPSKFAEFRDMMKRKKTYCAGDDVAASEKENTVVIGGVVGMLKTFDGNFFRVDSPIKSHTARRSLTRCAKSNYGTPNLGNNSKPTNSNNNSPNKPSNDNTPGTNSLTSKNIKTPANCIIVRTTSDNINTPYPSEVVECFDDDHNDHCYASHNVGVCNVEQVVDEITEQVSDTPISHVKSFQQQSSCLTSCLKKLKMNKESAEESERKNWTRKSVNFKSSKVNLGMNESMMTNNSFTLSPYLKPTQLQLDEQNTPNQSSDLITFTPSSVSSKKIKKMSLPSADQSSRSTRRSVRLSRVPVAAAD